MPSLFWIFCFTFSMASDGSTSTVIVLPVRVLMKIFILSAALVSGTCGQTTSPVFAFVIVSSLTWE